MWHRYATEIVPQRVSEATQGALRINVLSGVVPPGELLNAIKEGTVQGGSLQWLKKTGPEGDRLLKAIQAEVR